MLPTLPDFWKISSLPLHPATFSVCSSYLLRGQDHIINMPTKIPPYAHVLQLSDQMGNSVCQQFHREEVVCLPRMYGKVFTTASVDNIDHNLLCATTAKESFHGTNIFLLQHPSFAGEGVDRSNVFVEGSVDTSSKNISHLPHYYTDVPPVAINIKQSAVPATRMMSLARDNLD